MKFHTYLSVQASIYSDLLPASFALSQSDKCSYKQARILAQLWGIWEGLCTCGGWSPIWNPERELPSQAFCVPNPPDGLAAIRTLTGLGSDVDMPLSRKSLETVGNFGSPPCPKKGTLSFLIWRGLQRATLKKTFENHCIPPVRNAEHLLLSQFMFSGVDMGSPISSYQVISRVPRPDTSGDHIDGPFWPQKNLQGTISYCEDQGW